MPETPFPRTAKEGREDASAAPLPEEQTMSGNAAILDELCQLLLAKRSNAIELGNLAFILGHRQIPPAAAEALARVEAFGKHLLRHGMDEERRLAAIKDLQEAAARLGLEYCLQRHADSFPEPL